MTNQENQPAEQSVQAEAPVQTASAAQPVQTAAPAATLENIVAQPSAQEITIGRERRARQTVVPYSWNKKSIYGWIAGGVLAGMLAGIGIYSSLTSKPTGQEIYRQQNQFVEEKTEQADLVQDITAEPKYTRKQLDAPRNVYGKAMSVGQLDPSVYYVRAEDGMFYRAGTRLPDGVGIADYALPGRQIQSNYVVAPKLK
jgi:hypothetical protein